jgi:hypothetical protein
MLKTLLALTCLLSTAAAQTTPNPSFQETAVIPLFHEANPRMLHFQTFFKQPIDDQYTLLVVRGGAPGSVFPVPLEHPWWDPGTLVGIFVMATADPEKTWKLALLPDQDCDCVVRVKRADRQSIVLARHRMDYGFRLQYLKVFFDIDSKRVIKTIRFIPASASEIKPVNDHLHISTGGEWIRQIELRVAPDGLALENSPKGQRISFKYSDWRPDLKGTHEDSAPMPKLPYETSTQADFPIDSPGRVYPMSWLEDFPSAATGITERTGDGSKEYPLPQSTWEEFSRLRPEMVRMNSGRFSMGEGIGPHQVVGDKVWFGKVFYDGEGISGVGGMGYFDLALKKYVLFSPQPVADFSTSALLVEEGVVWAGLAGFPEGEVYGYGLLRYDVQTGRADLFRINELVLAIVRWQNQLLAGTSEGLLVAQDGQLKRYAFEPGIDGQFEVFSQRLDSSTSDH